jgi:hypothetical protein
MTKNPYQLPPHLINTGPLAWEMIRHRGRPHRGSRSIDAEVGGLLRFVSEGEFQLNMSYQGLSLLAASLSGWGTDDTHFTGQVVSLPLPGEPPRALLVSGVRWPEAIAGTLIHRGADPFVYFDHLRDGQEAPIFGVGGQTESLCLCPVSLALENGLDSVLDQMLRHPDSPPAADWDRVRMDGQPLLHVALIYRPRLLLPLLNKGLDPNQRDDQGRTPLFRATAADEVTALIKAGADPGVLDPQGRLATDVWQMETLKQRPAMVAVLKATGKTFSRPRPAVSPVFEEVMHGQRRSVPKSPLPLPPAIEVAGFDQPLSLTGHALLGVLAGTTVSIPQPLFDVLWPGTTVGLTERALVTLAAFSHPVKKGMAFQSQSQVKAREKANEWATWLQATAQASVLPTAQEMESVIPQMIGFYADRDPRLTEAKHLSSSLMHHLGTPNETTDRQLWQMVFGSAIWQLAFEISQRQIVVFDEWDPWAEFWSQGPSSEISGWAHSLMNQPLAVVHRMEVGMRHLLKPPLVNVTTKIQSASQQAFKDLTHLVTTWTPDHWETLQRAGVIEPFEQRMQASGVDLPWAGAWIASRRQLRTLPIGAEFVQPRRARHRP